MSDGLKDWATWIQAHPLVKHFIYKRTSQQDCQACIDMVAPHLSSQAERRMTFYICMELLQNISHHAHRKIGQSHLGVFFLNQDQDNWYVLTENTVKQDQIYPIQLKLDQVNELSDDKVALKQLYKEIIKSDAPIQRNAGLGFVDIVRKSKNRLQYQFQQVGQELVKFSIMATIQK